MASTPHVKANHKVPSFKPVNSTYSLPANPTDQDVFSHSPFEEPLVPIGGKTSPQENAALGQALTAYANRTVRDDFSAPEGFLASHPQSAWTISLLTDLGWSYRQTGWYSKALDAWKQAWTLGQAVKSPPRHAKATIDRALAELIVMNARVGRMDKLAELIKTADQQSFIGSSKEKLEAAKQALILMQKRPQTSFRCGPMAVEKIRNIVDKNNPAKLKVMSMDSTQKGTNMAQLKKLAAKLGLDYQVAKRAPGSEIIVPAVVNWKVGHFAALIDRKGNLWRLHDPTFGYDVWISKQALDAEASGYFLVKSGSLPSRWTPVNDEEAATVWGKGTNDGGDPNANGGPTPNCGCPGTGGGGGPGSPSSSGQAPGNTNLIQTLNMARYGIYEMLASLSVQDTPLFYTPPYGPAVDFSVTYSQREANQPSTFTYSNVGPLWTFNWLSYITDDPDNPGADITQYLSGGGTLTYTGYDSSTESYAPQQQTGCVVKITSSSSYELDEPDGSKQIFSAATTTSPRKIFMTQTIDPQGNGLTFSYDSDYRLVSVTDALGQVTTLSYGLSGDMYKITQVTDPFGRTATLTYTSDGNLQSSTDMIGITSTYNYTSDALTSMTTPYGTTTFDVGQNDNMRWVHVTDPQGGQERLETWNNYNYNVPSSVTSYPSGFDNSYLNLRNSFYWNKKAMVDAPGNYNMAQITHWLHEPDYSTMSDQVESVKAPLESRVYYAYPDQPANIVTGSSGQPTVIARIMDDGSTQEYQTSYNSLNLFSQSIDPLGRTTNYAYASNNVDLTEVSQQNGSSSDVLETVTYNSQHEPLTTTDASGETTTYTYNSLGQVLTITNAKSETTTFSYTGGYLTSITGPQSGATATLTYDSYGRIASRTGVDGYTVVYTYDSLNRLTKVTYPDGTYDQATYTNLDVTQATDRQNRVTQYLYNADEQLVGTIDSAGRVTNYIRCICGELKGLVDSMGHRTSWNQDIEGRTISKIYADNSQVQYAYDGTNRLKTVTDAKGQVVTYSYNEDDTLAQATYSNTTITTPTVSFAYDSAYPRLTSMTDGTGTTAYTYNPVNGSLGSGRLGSETGPLGSTAEIAYTYDQLGRVTETAVNAVGSSVTYDSLGRITNATNALGSFSYGYYGPTGHFKSISYPNGQSTRYGYLDNFHDHRLGEIKNLTPSGTILSQNDYTYNTVGTIATWQQQTDGNAPTIWNFAYDGADQLIDATQSSLSTASVLKQHVYRYDLAGNRTSAQGGLSIRQASFNNLNQITSSNGGGPLQIAGSLNKPGTVTVGGQAATMDSSHENFSGTANVTTGTNTVTVVAANLNGNAVTNNYQVVVPPRTSIGPTYDLNGNMLTNGKGQTYAWDARNELVGISYADGSSTIFAYDGLGRRVSIVEKNGVGTVTSTKQELWIGVTMAEERDASNTVQKRFFSQGEQVGGTSYYYTFDHLGSVREMCDSSGNVVSRLDYDPWGRATVISGTILPDLQYAGYYMHPISGLNLTLFRAYDSNMSRWLTRDPIGEYGGINLYGYVANDPMSAVDSLGLSPYHIPEFNPASLANVIPPVPPPGIPGGPWTWSPNPQNSRGGTYIGPKQPTGGRSSCTYAPAGPNNPNPYWKTTDPNGNQQRYNTNSEPITPDEAHPGPPQYPLILPPYLRIFGPLGAALYLLQLELQNDPMFGGPTPSA